MIGADRVREVMWQLGGEFDELGGAMGGMCRWWAARGVDMEDVAAVALNSARVALEGDVDPVVAGARVFGAALATGWMLHVAALERSGL